MMGITTPSGGIASRLRQEVGGRRDLTGQERACPPLRFERADSVETKVDGGNEGTNREDVVVLTRDTFDTVRSLVSGLVAAGSGVLEALDDALVEVPEGPAGPVR